MRSSNTDSLKSTLPRSKPMMSIFRTQNDFGIMNDETKTNPRVKGDSSRNAASKTPLTVSSFLSEIGHAASDRDFLDGPESKEPSFLGNSTKPTISWLHLFNDEDQSSPKDESKERSSKPLYRRDILLSRRRQIVRSRQNRRSAAGSKDGIGVDETIEARERQERLVTEAARACSRGIKLPRLSHSREKESATKFRVSQANASAVHERRDLRRNMQVRTPGFAGRSGEFAPAPWTPNAGGMAASGNRMVWSRGSSDRIPRATAEEGSD